MNFENKNNHNCISCHRMNIYSRDNLLLTEINIEYFNKEYCEFCNKDNITQLLIKDIINKNNSFNCNKMYCFYCLDEVNIKDSNDKRKDITFITQLECDKCIIYDMSNKRDKRNKSNRIFNVLSFKIFNNRYLKKHSNNKKVNIENFYNDFFPSKDVKKVDYVEKENKEIKDKIYINDCNTVTFDL